ncbi:MAG TPA: DUF4149 domain-containing protein [Blastocatellia bacterium]|nr:DUF4149 domain-containing protein [Blastocatellia bacterium]
MAANVANTETAKPAPAASPTGGEQFVAGVEALLLVIWLGAMIFFGFAVAPTVFAVLPTRELAGQVVNSLIGKLELLGLVCGPLLLLSQFVLWPKRPAEAKARVVRVIMLALMTLLVAASRFWVSAKLHALRVQLSGPIDDLPVTDPLRVEFSALHGVSVSLMGATMLAGIVVILITVRLWLKR